MNKHKEKCDKLKKVRKNIADKIGVDLHQKECTFSGNCKGTCPKCKQEEDILNTALLKKAGVAAFAAGAAVSLTACGIGPSPVDEGMGIAGPSIETVESSETCEEVTMGDIEYIEDDNTEESSIIEETDITMGELPYVEDDTEEESEYIEETEESESIDESMLEPLMGVAPYVPGEDD